MELFTTRGQVDLYDDFSYSLNYKTADVINLTGRKTAYTLTIVCPYTSNNALIFQGLDQPNSDNVGYDTRETLGCFLSHNGRVLLRGSLVVNSWSRLKERQEIEIQVIQQTKNLVSAIKGVTLNELDFSYLRHDYTLDNILLSYDGFNVVNGSVQARQGYIYPLVDYGKDDTLLFSNEWKVQDLRPCLFLREIIDTIFRTAGKTYTSNFFDSPYFQNLILLNTITQIKLTDDQSEPYETNVENSTTQLTEQDLFFFPFDAQDTEKFDDIRIDTIVSDVSGQWDISNPDSPIFTADRDGKYKFSFSSDITFSYAVNQLYIINFAPNTPNPFFLNQGEVTQYLILKRNGANFDNFKLTNTPIDTQWGDGTLDVIYQPQSTTPTLWEFEIDLNQGDELKFQILRDDRFDSGCSNLIYPRFELNNTRVRSELVESLVSEGDEINFQNYIPQIKADEFIDTIFNVFNLWVIDNPFQDDDLIIEPRTNFFDLGGFVDWSDKLDISREIKNDFLADQLPKRFKYKFERSDDVNSKNYFDRNNFGYCDYDSEVDTNINQDEQEITTKLTPLIATKTDDLIYPKLFAQDEGQTEKTDIGKVLKIGFVNSASGPYFLTSQTAGQTVQNEYIVCSEFDDPVSPIYSLTFGDPDTTLNQSSPSYWNLFRLFHQLTEQEKTRKGAKVVELFIYLDENDISQLDIRRVVFVNGVFYRIVSIDNYDPLKTEPTKVKLLQIEFVNYDFTSNEIIYKLNQGFINLLSTNKRELISTNKNDNVTI